MRRPTLPVFGVAKFERFFRAAAELDVDKNDLKRYSDFVERKLYDLLLIGQNTAGANGRDIVEPWDLPVTKGLQESMHAFRKLDEEIELEPLLGRLATYPPLDRALSEETEARLPAVVGAISIALARTFRVIDPDVRNPQSEHWERVFQVFDQLI
ncbi:DUF1931 family protein [Actinoplanes sp. KI2]|uniref:DUF1931 family protein n=1 Tax=Actinoplanes sp. KI2 TaxID=2983315 RepID=UPI0021D56E5C|nr:DUF1931 family protein [Actinoplanes sp. KI2]MCU7730807.1 DUF1931 family protein [Actinoplanes sp. KI2]